MWYIISIIISSIVSIFFSGKIIAMIMKILMRFDIASSADISGIWDATFEYPTENDKLVYTEVIELKQRFGNIMGYIISDSKNYDELKEYMNNHPLSRARVRVKASLNDNRFFTGVWFHPIEQFRFHGAFQMILSGNTLEMTGMWIGYREIDGHIKSRKWSWKKRKQ